MVGSNGYWFAVFLNILFATATYCIKITKVTIPEYHVVDKGDNGKMLVLDCEYQIDPSETGLVVKWSFRNDLIYQWIPGRNPYIMQQYMKGKIDSTYKVSSDPMHEYRALALRDPTWNSTGSYTCSAETFELDDRKSGFVQIIDISQSTIDICRSAVNEVEEISCITTNFYPQPIVDLSLNDEPLPRKSEKVQLRDNGLYNVTVVATSSAQDTTSGINCSLYFPKTNYTINKLLPPSGSSQVTQLSKLTILSTILTFILSNTLLRSV